VRDGETSNPLRIAINAPGGREGEQADQLRT
jgi:hypothetical protein